MVEGVRFQRSKWLLWCLLGYPSVCLASRLTQYPGSSQRFSPCPHPNSFHPRGFTSFTQVSPSYRITLSFWPFILLVPPGSSLGPLALLSLLLPPPPPQYTPWPDSLWTLPDASGCSLPHMDNKILSPTLELSCPHFSWRGNQLHKVPEDCWPFLTPVQTTPVVKQSLFLDFWTASF